MDFKNGDIVEVENISDLERDFPQYDWNLIKDERGIITCPRRSMIDVKFYKEISFAVIDNTLTLESNILRLANLDFYPGQEVLIKWKIQETPLYWIPEMDLALGKTAIIMDQGERTGCGEYYHLKGEGINPFVDWPPEALIAVSNNPNSYKNIGLNLLTKLW